MTSQPKHRKNSLQDEPKTSIPEKKIDLDYVLLNELGQFGKFQLRNLLLITFPIIMCAFPNEYVFSAAAIPHRCQIPECGEYSKSTEFEPEWIANVLPQTSSGFASCERFAPRELEVNGTLDSCPADLFDPSLTVVCDGFVYSRENSVVYDFDLGCQDWLRVLAGTLNKVGTLLVLPITGYISDRFGRKIALVLNVFSLALFGLMRAFSINYTMYMILHLVQTTLGGGTYSSAYIFVAELVGPNYRVILGPTSTSIFALGQVTLGAVAWLVQPWRYMIMALFIPCFLFLTYYWMLSESVRWLLSKKKFEEARIVLETIARVNKKQISEKSMAALLQDSNKEISSKNPSKEKKSGLIKSIVSSPTLLRRVCTTPIWWITGTFVYYGLSINSTTLSNTMYLNYILVGAVEIPGYYTALLVLDRVGRKATLSVAFFFSAACNIAFIFIPTDFTTLKLVIYLLGKFGISTVMTTLYLYTSELYPTEFRHTLLAFSSMVGRIGSITAPLTPVLMNYWHGIPSLMFGVMGIISGLLVLTQPETLGTKLPNTLAEAEALGKPETSY